MLTGRSILAHRSLGGAYICVCVCVYAFDFIGLPPCACNNYPSSPAPSPRKGERKKKKKLNFGRLVLFFSLLTRFVSVKILLWAGSFGGRIPALVDAQRRREIGLASLRLRRDLTSSRARAAKARHGGGTRLSCPRFH